MKHVVAVGDAFNGLTLYGPFESELAALDWADANLTVEDFHIVTVQAP